MVTEEVDQVVGGDDDVFATPEIVVPASPPEAHNASVSSVTLKRIDSRDNWPVLEIGLVSRDLPTLEDRISVFLPKTWADGGGIALGSKFDPSGLPEDKANGYFAQEQTMFQRGVANGDKSATLQQLVFNPDSVARSAGRTAAEVGWVPNPKTVDEYVENLGKMLIGVDCIMVRREKGGDDPAFKHALQASRLVPFNHYEQNPKFFKKLKLAWE